MKLKFQLEEQHYIQLLVLVTSYKKKRPISRTLFYSFQNCSNRMTSMVPTSKPLLKTYCKEEGIPLNAFSGRNNIPKLINNEILNIVNRR